MDVLCFFLHKVDGVGEGWRGSRISVDFGAGGFWTGLVLGRVDVVLTEMAGVLERTRCQEAAADMERLFVLRETDEVWQCGSVGE